MPTQNKTIKNVDISLDGNTFIGCHFYNCVLIYSELMPVTLKNCTFEKCSWSFAGSAKNTVGFMMNMYRLGGNASQVIESVFEQIRTDATGFKEPSNKNDIIN
jgi:hypothetical protein